jgi:hypothetical protein
MDKLGGAFRRPLHLNSSGALLHFDFRFSDFFVRRIFDAGDMVLAFFVAIISSSSFNCSASVSRSCVAWIRNTIRNVTIVVLILMTSCRVSLMAIGSAVLLCRIKAGPDTSRRLGECSGQK